MIRFIQILIVALVLGFAVYFIVCSFTYSEGERAGLLTKFSKKGFLFKTYEGELNVAGVHTATDNSLVSNIWKFSVLNSTLADTLMQMEGKNVRLHYRQKVKNFVWQGETPYFVDGVSAVQ